MKKVLYLARKLKAFTFNDIYILAEIDKNELEKILAKLVEDSILKKDSQGYIYIEEKIAPIQQKPKSTSNQKYALFVSNFEKIEDKCFYAATVEFMDNYVSKFCTEKTIKTYYGIFRNHILPYFSEKKFDEVGMEDIKGFFLYCENKNLSAKRLKNILTLLKQFLKYVKNNGFTNNIFDFQVQRLNTKNEFNLNRIIFENGG